MDFTLGGPTASSRPSRRSFPRMPWGMVTVADLASFLCRNGSPVQVPVFICVDDKKNAVGAWCCLGCSVCAVHAGADCALLSRWLVGRASTRWARRSLLGWGIIVRLGGRPHLLAKPKVTVYYAVLSVPLGQGFALLAAVILNASEPGSKRSAPRIACPCLAGVGMAVLWTWVFSGGLMNAMIEPVLSPLVRASRLVPVRPGLDARVLHHEPLAGRRLHADLSAGLRVFPPTCWKRRTLMAALHCHGSFG